MRLHFYGTGASEGFPALFCECEYCQKARVLGGKNLRTRTSCQLDDHILIDFSADSYMHVLYGGLDLTKIDHLLVTHSHSDHFYGADLSTVFPPMAWYTRKRCLNIYGNQAVKAKYDSILKRRNNGDRYTDFYPLKSGDIVFISDYQVIPLQTNHDPKEECFIYVIVHEGKTLLYGHDSATIPEETWDQLAQFKFDCVVLDCTSVFEHNAFQSHMSFVDNVVVRQRMLEEQIATENTIFISTHFAHTYAPFHEELTEEFKNHGFQPAYDGMVVEF